MKAARRRHSLRERAISYMGGCCQLGSCRYNACHNALEFHHIDPGGKDFTISARMTSWDAIRRELDKCILLCANHHREVHDGMHPGFLVLDGSDAGVIDLADGTLDEPDPEDLDTADTTPPPRPLSYLEP